MQLSRKRHGVGAVLVDRRCRGARRRVAHAGRRWGRTPRVATASGGTINIAGHGYAQTLPTRRRRGGPLPGREREQGSEGLHLRLQGVRRRQQRPDLALAKRGAWSPRRACWRSCPRSRSSRRATSSPSSRSRGSAPATTRATAPTASKGFGLSAYGCLIPTSPKRIPGVNWELLKKQLAIEGHRQADGRAARHRHDVGQAERAELGVGPEGVGFDVVYAKGAFPDRPRSWVTTRRTHRHCSSRTTARHPT